MRTLKLGIVGCGVIGRRHVQAAAAFGRIELVAVADLLEERGRSMAKEFRVSRIFRQGRDLVRDRGIEAVVLAIPTAGRSELACEAFRLGKHVLIEKPPAMYAGEIIEMMRLQGSCVGACCSSRFLFLPGFEAARAAFASGSLGALREIFCRVLEGAAHAPEQPPPAWRQSRTQNGGGILVNWGCYDLDYLLSITGWSVRPRVALAGAWPVADHLAARVAPGSDAESHYVALIRCAGGEVIHLERAEFAAVSTETAWQIIGTRGSLRLHMSFSGAKRVLIDETEADAGVTHRVLWEGMEEERDYHHGPVQDFAAAILDGRPPKTDLGKALAIQRIFDAIYASSASGNAEEIPQ